MHCSWLKFEYSLKLPNSILTHGAFHFGRRTLGTVGQFAVWQSETVNLTTLLLKHVWGKKI